MTAPADPPRPPPRIPVLQEQCAELSAALRRVEVHARYQHLMLLAWPDRTTDDTVQWAIDDAPTDQFERAHVWWPAKADRLPRAEKAALSAELLRQVLDRLAGLHDWPEHDLKVLLAVLAKMPTPEGRVVQIRRAS